jgi:Ca2+-binding RTX toxin-like protein
VVGGNDSADAGDNIAMSAGLSALIFGNGGGDTIAVSAPALTVIGGQGGDNIAASDITGLFFANEGNDTVVADGANTVFGGVGNDSILTGSSRDSLQGNEGNDTISGGRGIDTISGGSGNDVLAYGAVDHDGDNATGGGPVELVTDVDWSADKFDTPVQVNFAANMGAGTGATLAASATNAIAAALALSGNPAAQVAAQFTFGGRTYLAINQDATLNAFDDTGDLLVDITGVTGTIAAGNFI